jgi:hypothetical protein
VRGLRAVRTVFGTSSGFHAQQNAALDLVGLVILPMSGLGVEDQFRKREVINAFDLSDTPIVP